MSTPPTCPQCGAALSEGLLHGLCQRCIARQAAGILAVRANAAGLSTLDPRPPTKVRYFGDYELLEEIARGGMGVVWKARQVSLNRTVAVKMLLAGQFSSPEFVQRFRAEATAAANLQHPNIVAIHEVGEHEGHQYYSMDYVEGPNLAQAARDQPLPAKQAAACLKTIAEAVHYAHQRGVIHRDLKPSNVLLDAAGQPRVTDFGLAKFVAQVSQPAVSPTSSRQGVEGSEAPGLEGTPAGCKPAIQQTRNLRHDDGLTLTGQVLGTPAYMPPEQARGKRSAVTATSDVYSLGALLYFLLTGRAPFVADTLEETLRQVHESEPVSPRLLNPTVPRDLETITLKCLEKDRGRRYKSAKELAADIQRHLDDEPISARPPSTSYRFQKLVRRNKLAFIAVGAVAVALLVGLVVSLWQYADKKKAYDRVVAAERAQNQLRRKADLEASKSQHVASFLKEMLKGVGPSVALGRDTQILRELLDQTAARVARELAGEPEVAVELRDLLARVYLELGEYARAEALARENLDVSRAHFRGDHPAVASALERLGQTLLQLSQLPKAEPLVVEAVAMQKRLEGPTHANYAISLSTLALLRRQQGRVLEAEAMNREAVTCFRTLGRTNSTIFAQALGNLVGVLYEGGKFAEAETNQMEVLTLLRNQLPGEHPAVGNALGSLAGIYEARGNFVQAEAAQREALAMNQKLLGLNHPGLAKDLNNLAGILESQGRLTEAEEPYRQALALRQKHFGTEHQLVAKSMGNLANLLRMEGKLSEAEPLQREALAIQKRVLGPDHLEVGGSLNNLALVLYFQKKLAEAEAMMREALAIQRKTYGGDHPEVASMLRNLGRMALDQGKLADSETLLREALAMRGKLVGTNHPGYGAALNDLAYVLRVQGNLGEAETLFSDSLNIKKRILGGGPNYQLARLDDVAVGYTQLALTLLKRSNYTDCEVLVREWLELGAREMPDSWHTFNAQSLLGASLVGQRKFADAERALQAGYDGLQKRIPSGSEDHLKATIKRLVNLYVGWDNAAPNSGHAAKAAEWKQKLADFDRTTGNTKSAAP